MPKRADALRHRAVVRGEHELEPRMPTPNLAERFEQERMVLVRPAACRVEQELLAWLLARFEELVVEAEVDRADLLLRDAEVLDDRRRGVPRDRDHALALASGARV